MGKLGVRVFSYRNPVWKRHSYLVGNEQGGTTDILGWLEIDNGSTTIAQLRNMIEVHVVNRMNRRTPLFQETLEVMNNSHNFHRRPESDRRQYRLAMIAPDGDASKMEDMDLVNEEDEDETLARCLQPVLVIVPLFFVGPVCGRVCLGCEKDEGWRKAAILADLDDQNEADMKADELVRVPEEEAQGGGGANATAGAGAGAGAGGEALA